MVLSISVRFFAARPPALHSQQAASASASSRGWRGHGRQVWRTLHGQRSIGTSPAFAKAAEAEAEHSTLGIDGLDAKQKTQVTLFVDSLLDWNQRMNLTAVTDRAAVMERHVLDSLALLPVLEAAYASHCCRRSDGDAPSPTDDERRREMKVVDVGSGAGLPGVILAIARPAWQITLLESLQKRCSFLNHAVEASGLSNATVVRGRAEECGQDARYRGAYDVAVARAVAEMRVLSELCLPLVRVGGLFLAAKGPNPGEEVKASRNAMLLLGGSLLSVSTVASEGPLGQRTAIVCHKQKPTPAKYPRRAGTPGKSPL